MRRHLLLALLALLATALAPACSTSRPEPEPTWASDTVEAPSGDVLWNVALLAISQYQFPRGTEVDPNSMTIESGWKLSLSSFRGEGWRKKAVVRLTDQADGTWLVEVRVKKQINMSIVRPTDPAYADWKWNDDDPEHALVLLQYIRSSLNVAG